MAEGASAPGSSLGCVKPKANLADEYGNLLIDKYPSADVDYDVDLWKNLLRINFYGRFQWQKI